MVTGTAFSASRQGSANVGAFVVIDRSEETARVIESHLRNAGHPLKACWVAEYEALENALRRGSVDLVLCTMDIPDMPLKTVVSLIEKFDFALPVIALGTTVDLESRLAAMSDGAHDLVGYNDAHLLKHLELCCLREIKGYLGQRELRSTHARLLDFESRHLQLLQGTADAVAHIHEGILSHVNPAFATLLGFETQNELVGQPIMDIVATEHQANVKNHLKRLSKRDAGDEPLECALRHCDGHLINVSAQLTQGSVDGERFIGMLIRAEPATPVAETTTAAPQTAISQGRLEFFDRAAEDPRPHKSLLTILVDNFADVEERLSLRGAEVLMLQLRDCLCEQLDLDHLDVHRCSGNAYSVVMSLPDGETLEALARRVCQGISSHIFSMPDHEAQIHATVVGYLLNVGVTPEQAFQKMEREARRLTAKGGNTSSVVRPIPTAHTDADDEQRRAEQIREALDKNRFKLSYQAIASLEGDTRQHYDLLVRMIDEDGRELHAAEFIHVAARAGLTPRIDRWVTARALKVLRKSEVGDEAPVLFVKLSAETLQETESFIEWLSALLKEQPLRSGELCFELQEVVMQNQVRKAKQLSKALRSMGAGVAIEHFGVGSSSTQLLDHIPATFLKFHGSFTSDFSNKEVQKKIAILMDVAKQHSIKTIVSHVEDANVMARMWQMGVNYIQGYHIQEPEVVMMSADRA